MPKIKAKLLQLFGHAAPAKSYPYYLCDTKGCNSYCKSIRRADIEEGFESLLRNMTPSRSLLSVARKMFADLWDDRLVRAEADEQDLKSASVKSSARVTRCSPESWRQRAFLSSRHMRKKIGALSAYSKTTRHPVHA
ncbi:hypothetical protein AB9K34_23935 [Sedimentitalea sp. XS_ASV28]|uniref:hypothetical protein n=1 Tax=Sedimentitalea sp. XS_ASV28 TaxID=3241296 RepID=UPI003512902D